MARSGRQPRSHRSSGGEDGAALLDAVEQVGRADMERVGKPDDGREPRVAAAAFEEGGVLQEGREPGARETFIVEADGEDEALEKGLI